MITIILRLANQYTTTTNVFKPPSIYAFLTVSPHGMHWIIDMDNPQKKRSKAYRMERRHVAVQSGKEDQNHL